jgi:hypothetical protein
VTDAGCSGSTADPRGIVLALLDWTHGTFELLATVPQRRDVEVSYPITHLLLEHARISDEAQRRTEQLRPRLQTNRALIAVA